MLPWTVGVGSTEDQEQISEYIYDDEAKVKTDESDASHQVEKDVRSPEQTNEARNPRNQRPQSFDSTTDILSEVESVSMDHLVKPSGIGRAICCSIKNVPPELALWSMKTGIPVHELSQEDLAEIFPKLRVVADEKRETQGSEVVGNANSFEDKLPAHLQLPERSVALDGGPQSLYEYEYAQGTHMKVVYEEYGRNPRSLLKVKAFEKPPEQIAGGQVEGRVVIQVEVRNMLGPKRDGKANLTSLTSGLYHFSHRLRPSSRRICWGDSVETSWNARRRFCR